MTKAPLNTLVRAMIPIDTQAKLVLRKHQGPEIAVKRSEARLQLAARIELVPEQPLEPDTQYEVVLVESSSHPSHYVFGAFTTGNTMDTTAPLAATIGKSKVYWPPYVDRSDCHPNTPAAFVSLTGARDPDRNDARLLHVIWAPNARGIIDIEAPPTAYRFDDKGEIQLGNTSFCDMDDFPLPKRGPLTIAIATIDEAGNRSPVQRVTLDMNQLREAKP
jgi:hypothetical protein